jgi:hypothetical protein
MNHGIIEHFQGIFCNKIFDAIYAVKGFGDLGTQVRYMFIER